MGQTYSSHRVSYIHKILPNRLNKSDIIRNDAKILSNVKKGNKLFFIVKSKFSGQKFHILLDVYIDSPYMSVPLGDKYRLQFTKMKIGECNLKQDITCYSITETLRTIKDYIERNIHPKPLGYMTKRALKKC